MGDPMAASSRLAIDAAGVRKAFGQVTALDGVDLAGHPGPLTALLGPNGAGKTTLVRTLATLTRPDSGTIAVNGHDLRAAPLHVRRSISLTGQYAAVDDVLTGRENLVMMARLLHLPRAAAQDRAQQLLEARRPQDPAGQRHKDYSRAMRPRPGL